MEFLTGVALFLTGVALFLAGVWLIRRGERYQREQFEKEILHDRLRFDRSSEIARLKHELQIARREERLLTQQIRGGRGEDLDRLIAEDAIKRETRAKAALVAVLRKSGSTDAEIATVIEVIDSPEKIA